MSFPDTSVAGKLLVDGPGTQEARDLFASDQALLGSSLMIAELLRLVTPGAWVRTADAIHLVCALRLSQDEFITYDHVQARGAGSLGMTVRSPGLQDGWWRP